MGDSEQRLLSKDDLKNPGWKFQRNYVAHTLFDYLIAMHFHNAKVIGYCEEPVKERDGSINAIQTYGDGTHAI
ncbi:hypothetical protein EPN87_03795 [archaeon]|nr:MAG: hypothetical protein EPN87_03795 [archaeon]